MNIYLILSIIFCTFVVIKYILCRKWVDGRQTKTKYKKMCLWSFKIWKWGFDAYLLKYQPFTILNYHTDPVDGKHWRLNITLKGEANFQTRIKSELKNYIYTNNKNHFIFFRPDIVEHSLLVYSKKTIKLSFGFVKFN